MRAHHGIPDPAYSNSDEKYCCQKCGARFQVADELMKHIIEHCDEQTKMNRVPANGPRKYKKRSKMKGVKPEMLPSPPQAANESYDIFMSSLDSDDNSKRKMSKKTKPQQRPQQYQPEDNMEMNMLMNNLEDINALAMKSVAKPRTPKKVKKKEEKRSEMPSTSQQPGRPKMIHTQKTRVPVEVGSEGAKKGQKTKTLVTRTPKIMPTEHKLGIFAGGERNRPRTKNVIYHEGKVQFAPATFPRPGDQSESEEQVPSINMVNIKMEPGLQKQFMNMNNDHSNNNGNIQESPTKVARGRKRKGKHDDRILVKQELHEQETCTEEEVLGEEMMNNNNVEETVETTVYEEVVTTEMEVGFDEHIAMEDSALPMIEPVKLTKNDVEQDSADLEEDNDMDMQSLMDANHVPETIIPDPIIEYTCEMCEMAFSTRADLLTHVRMHI